MSVVLLLLARADARGSAISLMFPLWKIIGDHHHDGVTQANATAIRCSINPDYLLHRESDSRMKAEGASSGSSSSSPTSSSSLLMPRKQEEDAASPASTDLIGEQRTSNKKSSSTSRSTSSSHSNHPQTSSSHRRHRRFRMLTVGDGDLSLSLALARCYCGGSATSGSAGFDGQHPGRHRRRSGGHLPAHRTRHFGGIAPVVGTRLVRGGCLSAPHGSEIDDGPKEAGRRRQRY